MNNNFQEIETYDFTTPMSKLSEFDEMYKQESNKHKKKYNNENYANNNSLSDEDIEYKYNYRIFIKLENGTFLLAKWYTSKVSAVDELLSEIHTNIVILMKNQLNQPDDDNSDIDTIIDPKNKNCISKISSLSSTESLIAKMFWKFIKKIIAQFIIDIAKIKMGSKKNTSKLHLCALSLGIGNSMALPTEPPTYPLFAHKHPSKTRKQHVDEYEDETFEKCDIDTIGTKQTLHEYAARYNIAFTPSYNT
ncbi:hypothetical protein C2G38_2253491 [Gigaspora rosea]|uniref:Uncharacterized protein n=1 Tax=Gigaspora rosea TaxID=44941 RepID=A0A397UFA2_9GLOM|nr:hypothetical protein C2G38_2253491 [Gigaspora rosea]